MFLLSKINLDSLRNKKSSPVKKMICYDFWKQNSTPVPNLENTKRTGNHQIPLSTWNTDFKHPVLKKVFFNFSKAEFRPAV